MVKECVFKLNMERFNKKMKEMNYVTSTLADMAGISQPHISGIKNGNRCDVSRIVLQSLANTFKCSEEWLMGDSDDALPTTKVAFPVELKEKRDANTIRVNPIKFKKACVDHGNPSPYKLSTIMAFPYMEIKKAMVSDTLVSAHSVRRLCKEFGISESDITYNSEPKKTSAAPATPVPSSTATDPIVSVAILQMEQKKHDKEMAKDLAEKAPVMARKHESKTASMCKPRDGYISTGQLTALATIVDKHPELLDVLSGMIELDQSDYNHLLDHIKWSLSALKRGGES